MPAAISSSRNLTSPHAYEAALKNATRIEKAVRMERNGQQVVDLPRYLAAFQQLTDRALQRHEDGVSPALRTKHTELLSRLQKLEPEVAALSTSKAVATVPLAFGLAKDWPWKRVAKYAAGGAIALAAIPWCYSQFNHIAKVAENLGSNLKAASQAAQNMQESAAPIAAAGHDLLTKAAAAAGVPYAAARGGLDALNRVQEKFGFEPWILPKAPSSFNELSGLGMSALGHNGGLGLLLAGSGVVSKFAAVPWRLVRGLPAFPDVKIGPGTLAQVLAGLGLLVVDGNAIWPGFPNNLFAFLEAHSNTTIATMAGAGLTYATGCSTPTVAFAALAPAVANIVSQQSIGNQTVGEWATENSGMGSATIGSGVLGHLAASRYLAYQAAHQTAPAIATEVLKLAGAHGKGAALGAMKQAAAGAISNGPLAAARAATATIRPKLLANLKGRIAEVRIYAGGGLINGFNRQHVTEALASASITQAMGFLHGAANPAANDPNLLHLVQESATAAYKQGGIRAAYDAAAQEAVLGTYLPGGLNGVATAAAKNAAGNGGSWRNHGARMGTALFAATLPTLTRLTAHLAWEHPLEAATLTLGATGTTAASHHIRNKIAYELATKAYSQAYRTLNQRDIYYKDVYNPRVFKAAKRMLNFLGQGVNRARENAAKAAGNVLNIARGRVRSPIKTAVRAVRLPSERRVAGQIVGAGLFAAAIPAAIRLTRNSYNDGILGDLVSTANQNRLEAATIATTLSLATATLLNSRRHGLGTPITAGVGFLSLLPPLFYGLNQLNQKGYFGEHDYETIVSTIISSSITAATASIFEGSKAWQFEGGHLPYGVRTTAMAAAFPIAFRAIWEVRAFLSDKARAAFGWARDTVLQYPVSTSLSLAMGLTASAMTTVAGEEYPMMHGTNRPIGLLAAAVPIALRAAWEVGALPSDKARAAFGWARDTVLEYPASSLSLAMGLTASVIAAVSGTPLLPVGLLAAGGTGAIILYTRGAEALANAAQNSWDNGYLGQGFTWTTTGWSEGHLAQGFTWATTGWSEGYLAECFDWAISEWDRGYLAKGYNAIEEGIANAWNGIAAAWSRLLAPRVVPPKATAYNPPGVPTKAAVQKLLRV